MTTDRPVPRPPTAHPLAEVPPYQAGHTDGVHVLPDHVQFIAVGRYRDSARYQLLGWLRETDDPQRLLAEFTERGMCDVHFERRTSTHTRATLEDVAAERDMTKSIRDHFRGRGDREQRRARP